MKFFQYPVVLVIVINLFLHPAQSQELVAFPGAEGFGRLAVGGRGGDVYHVTNLNDSGEGSLRYGIQSASGPRTIVFDVSGNIMLNSSLSVNKPFLTIAGQTAPGDGITLGGEVLKVSADHLIIRYIRTRLGDQSGGDDDALSVTEGSNIILDHISASWSIDETLSNQSASVDSMTLQWSMVTESLRYSHHEKGAHGYGGIIGGLRQSYHHNLYAHHSSRSPKVSWRRHCKVDFRNNVIYNWGFNNCYDGASSHMNWVNNYYKAGPGTGTNVRTRIFQLSDEDVGEFAEYETKLYAEGNYVHGYPEVTADNWNGGIDFSDGATEEKNRALTPFNYPPVSEQNPLEIYPVILEKAGASKSRDSIDLRIVDEVKNGTVTYGNKGIIDSQDDVGGWPGLESHPAPLDTDQDGMPDFWEESMGLNPADPEDRNGDRTGDGYTNLEEYLNELVAEHPVPVYEVMDGSSRSKPLRCFPNPAGEELLVKLQGFEAPDIKIYNLSGQMVYNAFSNENMHRIPTAGFPPGIHLVIISGKQTGIYVQKMVIEPE